VLCHKYQAPKARKKTEKNWKTYRNFKLSLLPVSAASASPAVVAKKIIHISELEKPKTRDCQALKTLVQLNIEFRSQLKATFGFRALFIRSIV
jgi:hypothetical protein